MNVFPLHNFSGRLHAQCPSQSHSQSTLDIRIIKVSSGKCAICVRNKNNFQWRSINGVSIQLVQIKSISHLMWRTLKIKKKKIKQKIVAKNKKPKIFHLQKYEVEFLLQQQWYDPRLRYANQSQYEYLNAIHHHEDIWLPDTYFIMHGDFKDPIIPMHFALRIYRNGTINYLMRFDTNPFPAIILFAFWFDHGQTGQRQFFFFT